MGRPRSRPPRRTPAKLAPLSHAVVELQPAFAYHEVPVELLDGAVVDLSVWSVVATDASIAKLVALHDGNNACKPPSSHVRQRSNQVENLPAVNVFCRPRVQLLHLNLAGASQLTDRSARAIGDSSPALRSLDLSRAVQLSDAGVLHIVTRCAALESLTLRRLPRLAGAAISALGTFGRALQVLAITHCSRVPESALLAVAAGCGRSLETLDIGHVPLVTDALLRQLARNCIRLRRLNVSGCVSISAVGIVALASSSLSHLEELSASATVCTTDAALLAVAGAFIGLRAVTLAGCATVSDAGVAWLAERCPAIDALDVTDCPQLSDLALGTVGAHLAQLSSLSIAGCARVTGRGVRNVAVGCPLLTSLNASRLSLLDDAPGDTDGIAAVAQQCSHLRRLDLSECARIGDRALLALARGSIKSLADLRLSRCERVASAGVRALLTAHGTSLTTLHLDGCNAVDDRAFAAPCDSLHSLRLNGCVNVGDTTLRWLGQCAATLSDLDISGCARVTDNGVLALFARHPGARAAHMRHLWLRGLTQLTDAVLAWLAQLAPRLVLLDVTACPRLHKFALAAVASNWKFAVLRDDGSLGFRGFVPLNSRVDDWLALEDYGAGWRAALALQSRFRAHVARREADRKREERRNERAALAVQRVWRGRLGRLEAARRRAEHDRECQAAAKIQAQWRRRRAQRLVEEIRCVKHSQRRHDAARTIQLAWRRYCLRGRLLQQAQRSRQQRERQTRAATTIQRRWRGVQARDRVRRLRELNAAHAQRELAAIIKLQTRVRMRLARRAAIRRRLQLDKERVRQEQAARCLQTRYRGHRARQEMAAMTAELRAHDAASRRLQRWWLTCRGRDAAQLMALTRRHARENAAAMKLQAAWKRRVGRLEVQLLRLARSESQQRVTTAATKVQTHWRRRRERHAREASFREQLELIAHKAQRVHRAATLVQAHERGKRDRARVQQLRLARKQRWKWVEQPDGLHFYYHLDTGEVRVRRPQDVLDLLPAPVCDNCGEKADVECQDCTEIFCSPCWTRVHAGGRRRGHVFRSLWDWEGKRIDYDGDEFPSRWPPELRQDDRAGWSLRCHPLRTPDEVVGNWERYVDATSGRAWFFNRETLEDSYAEPPGVFATADDWTLYEDASVGSYFYNQRTGESTFERPEGWHSPNGHLDGVYAAST